MTQNSQSNFTAASRLPENIRFGTSSWTYPGWQGIVYKQPYKNEQDLKKNCLAEYGRFPWFRTVGIDSTFYGPPKPNTLQRYADQLPEDFPWVSKVWEEITIPLYPNHARYGAKAGKVNADFLNADKFQEQVLSPYITAGVERHTGPFVFQFQVMGKELLQVPAVFLDQLDRFLGKLPSQFQYAVEIRNSSLFAPEYFAVLNKHGVTHCFNHWSFMPPLAEQMRHAAEAGGLTAPFFVARILTPRGLAYDKAVERFRPYNSVKAAVPEMRADVVKLAKRAIERNVTAFVLVNNRCEGNAPQTIEAIGNMIVGTPPLP
jgi:uncharacterized protein YecE (DUF72 family)